MCEFANCFSVTDFELHSIEIREQTLYNFNLFKVIESCSTIWLMKTGPYVLERNVYSGVAEEIISSRYLWSPAFVQCYLNLLFPCWLSAKSHLLLRKLLGVLEWGYRRLQPLLFNRVFLPSILSGFASRVSGLCCKVYRIITTSSWVDHFITVLKHPFLLLVIFLL